MENPVASSRLSPGNALTGVHAFCPTRQVTLIKKANSTMSVSCFREFITQRNTILSDLLQQEGFRHIDELNIQDGNSSFMIHQKPFILEHSADPFPLKITFPDPASICPVNFIS